MNENEKIAKVIWHDALQKSFLPFGWGLDFDSLRVIENGTAFHVQGKIKGWVNIQLSQSHFYKVTIIPDGEKANEVLYEYVSLDKLVSLIDANMEYGISSYDYISSAFGLTPKIAV